MVSVIYAECHKYALYVDCRNAECHYDECSGFPHSRVIFTSKVTSLFPNRYVGTLSYQYISDQHKKFNRDKQSSLFCDSDSDEEKKVITFTPGPHVIQLFVRKLRVFALSQSVCKKRLETFVTGKHFGLSKLVNYGQKVF